MKFFDFFILIILFGILFSGLYFLWQNLPTETVEFETYAANISQEFPLQSSQFYPNMRYKSHEIGYFLERNCDTKKREDFGKAIEILEEKTILIFYETVNPQITIFCSNISPKPEEEKHFIAGEGGPTEIINASRYAVILTGKISFYRQEICDEPQVAIHEILHALGFNHNSNQKSIMYPITDCKQEIDSYIIDEINQLYSQPSLSDILIEKIKANKSGPYLNFEIVFANYGLAEIKNSSLNLIIENSMIKTFDIGRLDIGTKKSLTVTNLKIPRKTEEITLVIETNQEEMSKNNNKVSISLKETD